MKKEKTMKVYKKYLNKNCNTVVYLTDNIFSLLGKHADNLFKMDNALYTLVSGKYVEVPAPVSKTHGVSVEPVVEVEKSEKKTKSRKTKVDKTIEDLEAEFGCKMATASDLLERGNSDETIDGLGVIDDLPFN